MTDLDELERLLREAALPPKVLEEDGRYVRQHVGIALTPAEAALWYALRNSAEELIRDARRMEWAERNVMRLDVMGEPGSLVQVWFRPGEKRGLGYTIREAIDAAIAQEGKG